MSANEIGRESQNFNHPSGAVWRMLKNNGYSVNIHMVGAVHVIDLLCYGEIIHTIVVDDDSPTDALCRQGMEHLTGVKASDNRRRDESILDLLKGLEIARHTNEGTGAPPGQAP